MRKSFCFAAFAICTASLVSAQSGRMTYGTSADRDFPSFAQEGGGFYDTWIKDRLSVGLTFSTFNLTHGKRPANREEDFLGNINKLRDSHANQLFPVIEYQALDYLCLGISYMHIEASTLNFNNGEGDGNAILAGPICTADLTYPLWEKRIYPHIGVGVAFLKGDFDEDTWWNLGYSSPEAWEYYGRPSKKTRLNYYRDIDVDDQTKAFFAVGVSARPHPRVKLDLSYRRINLLPDCNFAYDYGGTKGRAIRNYGNFDMTGYFWLLSVSYIF